jgi:hypothetical protein
MVRPLGAQVAIKRSPSGFNLFSVEQDVEVGRQSAAEFERLVPLVTSARTEQFLGGVGALLATHAPGPRYPFRIRACDSYQINAFVLPGGPIYISQRLITVARSEAELAGVVAHSMAHVVLRHGTARASKAYLGKAGLGAFGGLVSRTSTPGIINAVGGFGMNAAFLTFGTAEEYEADALGAELMAKAGYDPVAMATMLATLRRERSRHSGLERFFSSHPSAPDRETRIRNLANILERGGAQELIGGFSRIRWRGAPASASSAARWNTATGTVASGPSPVALDVPAPSPRFVRFNHPDALLAIDHPANWDAHPSGFAVSFAPPGGVVEQDNGQPNILNGLIVNYYAPFEGEVERWNNSLIRHYAPFENRTRQRGILEDATDDLVRQILNANSYLSAPTGSARSEVVDGSRGYSVRLSGRSPVTGEVERVTVYTRVLPDDNVIYMACIAPGRAAAAVERACARMVQSLHVTETVVNRP